VNCTQQTHTKHMKIPEHFYRSVLEHPTKF